MADTKTVTLVDNEEVRVDLGRKHVHIRNLGEEMVYASVKPGIVPFADGILGIPAGAKDVLTNTDGYIYLKGTGTVQLVGSDYVNGVLSVMSAAGSGTANIDEAVALSVAKIVAGAPEDFDTLKEISDWISTHSDSAAAMNSDIQTLRTTKADKTEIPTSLPANGGNANTVNGHTVNSDVPAGAVFTDTTYSDVTSSASGLMSSSDKTRLDSAVQTIQVNGVTQTKTNGVVNLSIGGDNTKVANKLATPRNVITDLTSTTADAFDGTADISPGVSGILPIANGGTGNIYGYIRAGKKEGSNAPPQATVEGLENVATNECAHAEGYRTTAGGKYSHAEGENTTADGKSCHAEGYNTTAGDHNVSTGIYCHAEGLGTTATNYASHAEGYNTKAPGYASHAEGYNTTATGEYCHAEGGFTTAAGKSSHAEGYSTKANGKYSHACGCYSKNNDAVNDFANLLIVGNGSGNDARSNAFRVHSDGNVYGGSYHSSGADYAEFFEWLDGNIENEDRRGRFVTLYGNKIALANSDDDFILGVVSGDPSVIGDAHDDQWSKMYLSDIFGSRIFEDVDLPDELDEEGNVIIPAHSEHRMKLNPDYDNNQTYIPRSERSEWSAVGMMGKLVVVDDGTCEVDGWCTPSTKGVATKSETRTHYRVMERLDETHIRVLIL